MDKKNKIKNLLSRNIEEVIEWEHLEKALLGGKKLRVKLGIDPTAPDLHLGHAGILMKLRDFQELGHKVVLIIGDFTGKIGDPSGRSETRKPLTDIEVRKNMKSYLAQAGKIIDVKKTEVVYNSLWFARASISKMVELSMASTVQQVMKRADFKKRLENDNDITVLEILYPLFQGYDSYMVRADVELGGTDQKFNLLMGRRVQRYFGMKEQDILTVPLLEGLDGIRKMSKSFDNYIALNDEPTQMFGKVMSVPDGLIEKYFEFCTNLLPEEIANAKKDLRPRDLKAKLGFEIVKIYYGDKRAREAQENFSRVFSKRDLSGKLPILKVKGRISPVDLVLKSGVASSKARAWRLVEQGGFSVGERVTKDPKEALIFGGGETVRVGKKSFFRIEVG